jgi:hypothetical protein
MRTALATLLFCLLIGCGSAGGNPDGSTGIHCGTTADCPLQDAGGCDMYPYPENHYTCVSGYCCCAYVCNS